MCGAYLVIKKKRVTLFYFVQIFLIAASLFFILRAPGNGNRFAYEMDRYFPEFAGFDVGSKLILGFLENAHYYIAGGEDKNCYLFACMAGVLFLCFLTGKQREGYTSKKIYCGLWWRRALWRHM